MGKGIFIGFAALALLAGALLWLAASSPTEAPEQPIQFSHKVHAGDFQIPCQYCHVFAATSSVAGIPSVGRCMGCHKITAADRPEIQKLRGYLEREAPLKWRKVTTMPDFVFFEHWPHVRASIECRTCHGPVETMERMREVKAFTMKDCLSCHKQQMASLDCAICHR